MGAAYRPEGGMLPRAPKAGDGMESTFRKQTYVSQWEKMFGLETDWFRNLTLSRYGTLNKASDSSEQKCLCLRKGDDGTEPEGLLRGWTKNGFYCN